MNVRLVACVQVKAEIIQIMINYGMIIALSQLKKKHKRLATLSRYDEISIFIRNLLL